MTALLFVCLHVCSVTLTAAEPWPETATLYQPLKGKSHDK